MIKQHGHLGERSAGQKVASSLHGNFGDLAMVYDMSGNHIPYDHNSTKWGVGEGYAEGST